MVAITTHRSWCEYPEAKFPKTLNKLFEILNKYWTVLKRMRGAFFVIFLYYELY